MPTITWCLLWAMLPGAPPEGAAPSPRSPGVVFVVGGVGGIDPLGWSARRELPRVGVPHEIRDFSWSHGRGRFLQDLQDHEHLLRKAAELAEQVERVKAAAPERRVYLLAKSGGTGLALAAAERLPPQTLERIILLSSAVSPIYDLRPALRATRAEIVSYYSPHDRLVLGWGTTQFGTVDRIYGPSAGLHGFTLPPLLDVGDAELYRRLVQISWHPQMLRHGFAGAHVGDSFPAFVGHVVAPWLRP